MSDAAVDAAQRQLANKATHVLLFRAVLPPLGLATFTVESTAALHSDSVGGVGIGVVGGGGGGAGGGGGGGSAHNTRASSSAGDSAAASLAAAVVDVAADVTADVVVQSDTYALTFDGATGLLSSLTNKKANVTLPLQISLGWYNSSVGGCTEYGADVPKERRLPPCSGQHSGAYIFRPNSSSVFYPGPPRKPSVEVVRGPLVTEVRQTFSSWATHVIRLYEGEAHVEIEWTVGPIPLDTPWFASVATDAKTKRPLPNHWGKEVVVKYQSGLRTGQTWYSDSNGKEMVQRRYNRRGPSYPHDYNISEPVAGNCARGCRRFERESASAVVGRLILL